MPLRKDKGSESQVEAESYSFDGRQLKLIEAVRGEFNNLAPWSVKVSHRDFTLSCSTLFPLLLRVLFFYSPGYKSPATSDTADFL